ncbi:RHS repeat-associated core domain-containing protein [Burkholderia sp. S-53]|uniref:RHS repeat-associated core domain-containing protein n=1 Tax=Burkholderia sp. S-53 TaxID=2906514 RepID=UPI0021CEF4A0|nr:RHS repeat-associated core domain-containing protein [Burkholderia sp. S-53]UXU85284.1 RHS repeat-associated core domain-containing protein [Burkholderia sp. S-53]
MNEKTGKHGAKSARDAGSRPLEQLADSPSQIFTQAAGMTGLSYDLNPRTGLLQASMVLGQLSYGIQAPVGFAYVVYLGATNYYRLSASDAQSPTLAREAFGFNVPLINPWGSGKMHLSDGTVDTLMNLAGNEPTLQYHRLNDMKIQRVSGAGRSGFQVTYKSGAVEYYNADGVILRRCMPSGFWLDFEIEQSPAQNRYRLKSVKSNNASSSALNITHGDVADISGTVKEGRSTIDVVQTLDGQSMATQCVLRHTQWSPADNQYLNAYVEKISLPNDPDRWIEFAYRDFGSESNRGMVLEKIVAPTGEYLRVKAWGTAKYYDDPSATPPVSVTYPVVTTLEEGNQKGTQEADPRTITYTYSPDSNCTGYYPGRSAPLPDQDNCILITNGAYTYSSKASYLDRTIETTYNRFHLPVKQTTVEKKQADGSCYAIEVSYTYPLKAGDISSQPAEFALWERMTTTYLEYATDGTKKNERTVLDQRSFDQYGNPLELTQSSGIQQIFAYYPIDSTEAVGCPPSPLFVRFVRQVETFPNAASAIQPPKQTTESTYTRINGIPYTDSITGNPVSPYMVLEKESKANGVVMGQYQYLSTAPSNPPSNPMDPMLILNGVQSQSSVTSTLGSGADSVTLTNTSISAWSVTSQADGGLRVTCEQRSMAQKGNDPAQGALGGTVRFNPSLGRVLEERAPTGAITRYEYNGRNWLIKKTAYADTPYQEIETYDFKYWAPVFADDASTPAVDLGVWANRSEVTYPNGRKEYQYLDRDGLLIYVGHADSNQYNEISQVTRYNREGPAPVVAESLAIDYVGALKDQPIQNRTLFAYRLFGLVRTQYADGTADVVENNLAATPPYQQIRKGGQTVDYKTEYNDYGAVSRTSVTYLEYESKPDSKTTSATQLNEYDGFGRLVKTTQPDAYAVPVSFEYDQFDRVTRQTCGTDVTTYTYSAQIPIMNELSRIQASANGVSVMDASREFDGFGRIIQQSEPGFEQTKPITKTLRYPDNENPQPESVTCNIGVIDYEYQHLTQMLLGTDYTRGTNAEAGPTARTYSYNPITKQMSTCDAEAYDASGATDQSTGYNWQYNAYGVETAFDATYKSGADHSASIQYEYSKFSSFQEQATVQCDHRPAPYVTADFFGSDTGRLERRRIRRNTDPESNRAFYVDVVYEDDTNKPGTGEMEIISLWYNPGGIIIMQVEFTYDQYGNEKSREFFIYGPSGRTSVVVFSNETLFTGLEYTASTRWAASAGGGSELLSYNYMPQYQQLAEASHAGESGADKEYALSDHEFIGFYRFKDIEFKNSNGIVQEQALYQYQNDQIRSVNHVKEDGKSDYYRTFAPSYDGNGNVLTNRFRAYPFALSVEEGRDEASTYDSCGYSPLNQLTSLAIIDGFVPPSGKELHSYSYFYDGLGQLIHTGPASGSGLGAGTITRIYDQGALLGELGDPATDDVVQTLYLQVNGILLGRVLLKRDNSEELELFCTDESGSVRAVYRYRAGDANVPLSGTYYEYSDYGARYAVQRGATDTAAPTDAAIREPLTAPDSAPVDCPSAAHVTASAKTSLLDVPIGFKGYQLDQPSGCYVLGNGYRFYNPLLRAFYSPDGLSPFGKAGINRYQYCNLDPVNNSDPSGAWSWEDVDRAVRGGVFLWSWAQDPLRINYYARNPGQAFKDVGQSIAQSDPAYQPDPNQSNYYIPKVARVFQHFGEGIDLAVFFGGNLLSAGAPLLSGWGAKAGGRVLVKGGPQTAIGEGRGMKIFMDFWGKSGNSKRLNISPAHGASDAPLALTRRSNPIKQFIFGYKEHTADDVVNMLRSQYAAQLNDAKSIRILSCHSADSFNGTPSFGEQVHKLTGLPVKAFSGTVTTRREVLYSGLPYESVVKPTPGNPVNWKKVIFGMKPY